MLSLIFFGFFLGGVYVVTIRLLNYSEQGSKKQFAVYHSDTPAT